MASEFTPRKKMKSSRNKDNITENLFEHCGRIRTLFFKKKISLTKSAMCFITSINSMFSTCTKAKIQ